MSNRKSNNAFSYPTELRGANLSKTMPQSSKWSNEETIYNQLKASGETTFIDVEICIDIKNAEIRPSYITKKILKGTEIDFMKKLGIKSKAKEASFFAYIIVDNKKKMYYYSSINILKKGSLVWYNHNRFIVESIDEKNNKLYCRDKKGNFLYVPTKEASVMKY